MDDLKEPIDMIVKQHVAVLERAAELEEANYRLVEGIYDCERGLISFEELVTRAREVSGG